jgi:hypothetical protein
MSRMTRFGTTKIGMERSTAMPSALQIRQQITAFLASEQSLTSFVEWLTRNIWNSDTEEAETIQLAGDVELIVTEYSAQHIDAEELRRQLTRLLEAQSAMAGMAPRHSPR